jgi:hypothetical protein
VELIEAVVRLREGYPRRGKDRLVVLLRGEGHNCSAATVARILHKQKERGVFNEPLSNHISARKKVMNSVLRPFLGIVPGGSGQMTQHELGGESEKGVSDVWVEGRNKSGDVRKVLPFYVS